MLFSALACLHEKLSHSSSLGCDSQSVKEQGRSSLSWPAVVRSRPGPLSVIFILCHASVLCETLTVLFCSFGVSARPCFRLVRISVFLLNTCNSVFAKNTQTEGRSCGVGGPTCRPLAATFLVYFRLVERPPLQVFSEECLPPFSSR